MAVASVASPVVLAAAVNGVIYSRGWDSSRGSKDDINVTSEGHASQSKGLPPGWAIAVIWTVILALLGYAHYRTFPSPASFAILAAIVYCLAYPFLTGGLKVNSHGKVLNTGTLIIAAVVLAAVALRKDGRAALATIPLLAWAAYVNVVDAFMCQKKTLP